MFADAAIWVIITGMARGFANVAFSDGSLPWGFLQRLAKRQPLAGPSDVRRFLVREVGAPAAAILTEVVEGRWRKEVKERAAAALRDLDAAP